METGAAIRCRVVACREALGDGREWSFYPTSVAAWDRRPCFPCGRSGELEGEHVCESHL